MNRGKYIVVRLFSAMCIVAVLLASPYEVPGIGIPAGQFDKTEAYLADSMVPARLVAHACGEFEGKTYTNSLNALTANYKRGFRIFEIDFNMTSDGQIVLLHDWGKTAKRLLGTGGMACTYRTFKKLRAIDGLKLMDLNALAAWMKGHPDAYVVTDCKVNNLQILKTISKKYPFMTRRLYPQMGPFNEYTKLEGLGYGGNIILALYKSGYTDEEILSFVRKHRLFAVSMWEKRALTGLTPRLVKLDVKVYAHIVNSFELYRYLLNNRIYGVYTDSIVPTGSVSGQPRTALRSSSGVLMGFSPNFSSSTFNTLDERNVGIDGPI